MENTKALAEATQQIAVVFPQTDTLIDRFIDYIDASQKTIETYKRSLKQWYCFLRDNKIYQPTRADVKAYKEYLLKGHKPATVTSYIMAVKSLYNFAEAEEIYPNIAKHIKGCKISREPKKDYLTADKVSNISISLSADKSIEGLRNRAIFILAVSCGLRTIEMERSDVRDITTSGGTDILLLQGKGHEDKDDYVILPQGAKNALQDYIKLRQANANEPLFISHSHNKSGCRLTTRSISGIIKEAMQKCGYDSNRLTAHSLRHTAITLSIQAGADIKKVQEFARHSDINTTMIYVHENNKINNPCANIIDKLIN